MAFHILRNDITMVKADAIVNTANPDVTVGDGVDFAVYTAAGWEELRKEREKFGVLMPGEVCITPAFRLPARYVIHVSGSMYIDGKHGEPELLRSCYDKALALAVSNDCTSIAFPLLATGTYGFPTDQGIQIAVEAFREFLKDHELEIFLVVFGKKAFQISGRMFQEVKSFLKDHEVLAKLKKEYRNDGIPTSSKELASERPLFSNSSRNGSVHSSQARKSSRGMRSSHIEREAECASASFREEPDVSECQKEDSLEDRLQKMYTDSFEKHLQQLLNKKGFKNSEVYSSANISKQYFSRLLKGQVKPSKEKVLSLAVGLHLNIDETIDFLRFAGYAFSPVSQIDVVVEYFIQKKDFDVMKIDLVLFDYGLPLLSE